MVHTQKQEHVVLQMTGEEEILSDALTVIFSQSFGIFRAVSFYFYCRIFIFKFI